MAYADTEFYKEVFNGLEIEEAELQRLLAKASRDVDLITKNRIGVLEKQPHTTQDCVKMATCYQAEYLYENGETIANSGADDVGFSLGGFSINNGKNASQDDSKSETRFSKSAYEWLAMTGLLYRGVGAYGI